MTTDETTETRPDAPLDVPGPQDADDLTLWSVTTIIGALDKPALLYWAAAETAISAIDSLKTWQAMLADQGRDETVKWLRDARFRRPKFQLSAADLGTVTHDVCETYALTGQRPDRDHIDGLVIAKGGIHVNVDAETAVVQALLAQFDRWLDRFQPAYEATEVTVYSPTYGYAGTLDAILTIDGVKFITDYKTSREPYDGQGKPKTPYGEQVGLQLAAYRNAEFAAPFRQTGAAGFRPRRFEKWRRRYYLLHPTERALAEPMPAVDTGLVIQITPESCEAFPCECGAMLSPDNIPVDGPFYSFLNVLEAFRWLQETSKTVLGEPLQ
jgi:PD-(D/E)XK nuclease superfamily